jgi:hypothetical protein
VLLSRFRTFPHCGCRDSGGLSGRLRGRPVREGCGVERGVAGEQALCQSQVQLRREGGPEVTAHNCATEIHLSGVRFDAPMRGVAGQHAFSTAARMVRSAPQPVISPGWIASPSEKSHCERVFTASISRCSASVSESTSTMHKACTTR